MTIAEKYASLRGKTIREIVLEIVENIAQNYKGEGGLEIVCGWWKDQSEPEQKKDSIWFHMMAGECYHDEINAIMRAEGFHVYEDYERFRYRARTRYRLV